MKIKQKTVNFRAFSSGLLSFAIPVFVASAAFFSVGIYPGSSLTLLTYDLRFQLLPFYGYLSNGGGPGFDNFLYSMSGGLGGGFFGTLALYISPFDLIYSFIPLSYLADAVYFMIIAKIGLCGLAFSYYLRKSEKCNLSGVLIITLSCCYALMSYNITYFVSPMWYDAIILLPLLAHAAEKIISGNKSRSFVLLMTFCIFSDYYMAYMVAIALSIYVVFRLIEDRFDIKTAFKRFISFAVHGIFAGGMSLFVIFPVALDFRRGKFLEGDFATSGAEIKNSIFDVLSGFMSQRYSGMDYDASPNIFCGSLILIAALFWLLYGKKNARARLSCAFIILLYFLSFMFAPLDRIWHGFRDPVCLSCRYAFTFVFFMLIFAARGFDCIGNIKVNISAGIKSFLLTILVLFSFAELYVNASYILSKIGEEFEYTNRDELALYTDVFEKLVPYDMLADASGYGRLITDFRFTNNDNAMYGYDGFARFSSSYNYNLSKLFRSFGVDTSYHVLNDNGITPPIAGLSGAKFFISSGRDLSYVYTPIASYDGYILYEDEYAFPLAFEIADYSSSCYSELTMDPFDNINKVYDDLTSEDDVFLIADYSYIDESLVESDGNNAINLEIRPQFTGHYFMYSEFAADEELLENDPEAKLYSFCFDVGLLEAGETYNLTLATADSIAEKVWIYYFNVDAYKTASESVNGFTLSDISGKGIIFKGSSTGDSDLFISLPYESGYTAYVDGNKTEYSSYRDAFLVIPISGGEHIVEIRYFPPGLALGLVLSIICTGLFALFLRHGSNHKSIPNDEEN